VSDWFNLESFSFITSGLKSRAVSDATGLSQTEEHDNPETESCGETVSGVCVFVCVCEYVSRAAIVKPTAFILEFRFNRTRRLSRVSLHKIRLFTVSVMKMMKMKMVMI